MKLAMLALAACGAQTMSPPAGPDATTTPDAPLAYGERCGNALDDDGDGLADEDCAPSLFVGAFAPAVAGDPAIGALEAAGGRLAVLQTYHATSAAGVARIAPDLAAIFASGRVAHLNVEPAGYTRAQYAAPARDPIAHDLAATAAAVAAALAADASGRVLLTFGAEMNGSWTDWGCLAPADFVALHRAAHAAVDAALAARGIDARRVRWVYGPNATSSAHCGSASGYFPGADGIDLLGMSAYRSGSATVDDAVLAPMARLYADLGDPAMRFVVLQTGSRALADPADRDAWIRALLAVADRRIAGAIYFDGADWAVDSALPGLATAPVADRGLAGVFAPHFRDVAYEHPAFGEVQALRDAGATAGCATAPPRFCPDDALDRRTAAVLVARAFGIAPAAAAFTDIAADDPAAGAIGGLVARGAMLGCAPDRFCPTDPMTEAELAAVVAALGGTPPHATLAQATRARAAVVIARGARLVPRAL